MAQENSMEVPYNINVVLGKNNRANICIRIGPCKLIWTIDMCQSNGRWNMFIQSMISGEGDCIKVSEDNDQCFLITEQGKIGYVSGFSGDNYCKIRIPAIWLIESLEKIRDANDCS